VLFGTLSFGARSLACASTPPGASDASLAQAQTRASAGDALYQHVCASCHGPRGEGLAGAPAVIGITGLPRYPRDTVGAQMYQQDPEQIQRQAQLRVPGAASREQFVTAADLHSYLTQHLTTVKLPADMPSVKDDDVWAIVTFVLIAHGSNVPETGVSPENASALPIRGD
jgi:mono/diheme cytochrome c family protein